MKPFPDFHEIAYASEHYRQVLNARDRILRQPLALKLTDEDTLDEDSQRHFVIGSHEQLVGGVIVKIEGTETARLRQMWVEPKHSGRGFGKQLMMAVLDQLAGEGIKRVHLHAREPVIGFYRNCGFETRGEIFEEVGIPHRLMTRNINREIQWPDDRR